MSTEVAKGKKAWLATSTGLVMEGRACGAEGTAGGELVFDTRMSGYQELITNPATTGQALIFTMTEVGNYGVNKDDITGEGVYPAAVIARTICDTPSNWASEGSLPDYLAAHGVVAIDEVDTRMLTRLVRDKGPLTAIVTTEEMPEAELIAAAKAVPLTHTLTEAEALAQELGATLTKLPIGHNAANIPVKNLRTGKLHITSQHHGHAIDFSGVEGVEVTHINLNDQTVEGFAVPAKGLELTLFDSLEIRELIPATKGEN
jgi:carbamoylphosphate synthase small subunit